MCGMPFRRKRDHSASNWKFPHRQILYCLDRQSRPSILLFNDEKTIEFERANSERAILSSTLSGELGERVLMHWRWKAVKVATNNQIGQPSGNPDHTRINSSN